MKTISKLMIGIVLAAFMFLNSNAQPKSEIPDDNKQKMNWSDADTLYTFQFNSTSRTWEYFQREIRLFDKNDYPLENFVQNWQSESKNWRNYLRINYSYDENSNEIEEITQSWDPSTDSWINAQLKITSYKGRNKDEILFQQWQKPANEWFNIMKYLITYNHKGDKNAVIISLYNGVTRHWDYHKKFNMEFDTDFSPPSVVIAQSWISNNWKKEGKYEIEYNWRGKKSQEIRYTWNQGHKNWLEGIFLEMNYDKKGNQTEYIEKKYDYKNKSWMNFNKYNALYNEDGYMTEKTEFLWNRSTNLWDEDAKFKFTTDTKI